MHETLNLHGRPIGDRGSPRRLLRRFWRTASRYWSGKSCTKAWGLSGGLLLAIVLLVAAAYAINLWNRAIFDGLQSKDASAVARLSFVLLTFGAAIGLSATSPWPNSGLPTRLVASLAVFCTMAQQIGAVMVGGYVAGRMRTRWHESGHEAEFRDGLHGALVWAIGVLISTLLVFTTLGAAARTGADLAGRAAGSVAGSSNPLDTALDAMLRPTSTAASPQRANTPSTDETPAEMSRILASSVTSGTMAPEKRTQLAQLSAQRSGISQQEAERRVDEAVNAARAAADKARHAAILTGFVTAASLMVSLAAGWWAAMRGGHHRDTSLPARFTFGDRRRARVS